MSKLIQGSALIIILIVVILFATVGYILFTTTPPRSTNKSVENQKSVNNVELTNTLTPTTATSDEFPVLYPELKWTKVYEDADLQFINKEHEIVISKGLAYESEKFEYDPDMILKYYEEELTKLGWVLTETAGGPEGQIYGYQNGANLYAVEYKALSEDQGLDRKIDGYKVIVYHN